MFARYITPGGIVEIDLIEITETGFICTGNSEIELGKNDSIIVPAELGQYTTKYITRDKGLATKYADNHREYTMVTMTKIGNLHHVTIGFP